jgi:DNA-binding transcriptional LysR family regulator
MDLNLLKTFLEVYRERHFARAADNLFITPSAVSARIHQLEDQLGVSLFERERNNIRLTAEGERLLNHAKSMVKNWEHARYDVIAGSGASRQFTILGVPSLWETALLPWSLKLRQQHPELKLKLESLPSEVIWRKLQQNEADLGFLYEPHSGPELQISESGSLDLTMVSTQQGRESQEVIKGGYMMVDYGASFMTRHHALFPSLSVPSTFLSTGRVAHDFLISGGGSGCYLPADITAPAIDKQQLFPVFNAQTIVLPVYAVYPVWSRHMELINEFVE